MRSMGVLEILHPQPHHQTTTEDFLWLKQETGEILLVFFVRDKKHSVFNEADMRDLVEGFVYIEIQFYNMDDSVYKSQLVLNT